MYGRQQYVFYSGLQLSFTGITNPPILQPVIVFPAVCSACGSSSGRRVIPESPEVETFRCGACGHQWSEPAPTVRTEIPRQALPWDWFRNRKV
jgi:Zn ribbon nucleic-acid-binding protein